MKEQAQVAYEGYRNHTGGKSLATGQPIPEWHELREDIKEAWRASVRAITSEAQDQIDELLCCVDVEIRKAKRDWPPFNSAHEAYAVMAEEVEDVWSHVIVKQPKRNLEAMRKEAIQVAAMAVRFALEVCGEVTGRN